MCDYETEDWPLTLAFGVVTGLVSIVINLIYLVNYVAPSGFCRNHIPLYVIPAVVLLWLMRIWLFSHLTRLDDDQVRLARRDSAGITLAATDPIAFMAALC